MVLIVCVVVRVDVRACVPSSLRLRFQLTMQKLGQWADVISEMLQAGFSIFLFKLVGRASAVFSAVLNLAWNFHWKNPLLPYSFPCLLYQAMLATALLGSFEVRKMWVEQSRKKRNTCCEKLYCCCSFLPSQ